MADEMITRHQIKFALGGMRFDRDINVGWEISPSIGIVAKDIDRMGLALASFREPLTRSIEQVMIPSIRKNFEKGGRPEKWEPLAPYTLQVKGRLGIANGDLPLHRFGTLKRGATQFSIWDVGDTSATIRKLPSAIWYGAIHQQGVGGFGVFARTATKSLGAKAGGMNIFREALRLMDEARGGARGERASEIPQRRFILFQDDDVDDIQQVFYEWLVEQTIIHGRFSR